MHRGRRGWQPGWTTAHSRGPPNVSTMMSTMISAMINGCLAAHTTCLESHPGSISRPHGYCGFGQSSRLPSCRPSCLLQPTISCKSKSSLGNSPSHSRHSLVSAIRSPKPGRQWSGMDQTRLVPELAALSFCAASTERIQLRPESQRREQPNLAGINIIAQRQTSVRCSELGHETRQSFTRVPAGHISHAWMVCSISDGLHRLATSRLVC